MVEAHGRWSSRKKGIPVNNLAQQAAQLDATGLLAVGRLILEHEVVCLDERRWGDWLELFAQDCEYWAPAWKMDGLLTSDPQAELSHIYYPSRAGLEDRVIRIQSRSSPASQPGRRTAHLIGNIQLLEEPSSRSMRLRSTWVTHVFTIQTHEAHAFFGYTEHSLIFQNDKWVFSHKKIILQNDYIPSMLDIQCFC
jgi:3-phenylpropionate/cinnamic acid dioxygenase small subunit